MLSQAATLTPQGAALTIAAHYTSGAILKTEAEERMATVAREHGWELAEVREPFMRRLAVLGASWS